MKYLLLALIAFSISACAHSKKSAKVKELVLLEATSKGFTSGIERSDGKSSGTSYNFIFKKPESISFEKVWIFQTSYAFTEFDNDGDYYVTVQSFSGSRDNVLMDKLPIETRAKAVIQYKDGLVTKYMEVTEIVEKEAVISQ